MWMGHWLLAPGDLALATVFSAAKVSWLRGMTGGVRRAAPSTVAEGAAFLLQGGTNSPPGPQILAGNFPLTSACWFSRVIINRDCTLPDTVCPRSHCWKQAARLRPNLFHPSRNLLFSTTKTKQRWEEVALPWPQRTGLPQRCCNFTEYGLCSLQLGLMT